VSLIDVSGQVESDLGGGGDGGSGHWEPFSSLLLR
jgi:hypothetical protein